MSISDTVSADLTDLTDVTDLADPNTSEEAKHAAKVSKRAAAKAKKLAKKLLKEREAVESALQERRDEMKRELKLTERTYTENAASWETMLADIQQDVLRKEVDGVWADVTQMLDRKQNVIERLTADRVVAQEQIHRTISLHRDFLDNSKNLFRAFAMSLRGMYDGQVEVELSDFRKQCGDNKLVECRRKHYFENLMLGSNTLVDEHLLQLTIKFDAEKEDFVNTNVERRETIRDSAQHSMDRLFAQMKRIVENVRRTSMSKDRLKEYSRLVARNKQDNVSFAHIQKRMDEAMVKIGALKEERHRLEVLSMNDLIEMKKEKEYFMKCFAILRDRYERDMSNDQKLMRCLMDKTYLVITALKEIEKRGGLILGVSNVVRKFQTEKEKVVPWPENFKEDSSESIGHVSQMESFWIKVASVNKQNLELEAEKKLLEKENQRLRENIKRFCTQDKYERCIRSLKISQSPTTVVPIQEAAHMKQLKKFSRAK